MTVNRRVLSCWSRWREARSEAEVHSVVHWAGLSPGETACLHRLEANRLAAGSEDDWFRQAGTIDADLRHRVVPTLLRDVTLPADLARRFVVALGLQTPGRTELLYRAVAEAVCSKEELKAFPQPKRAPGFERLKDAVATLGVDVCGSVSDTICLELAHLANLSPHSIRAYLAKLRHQHSRFE